MNALVPIAIAALFFGLTVGAAIGVWSFPREVRVEVPVEIVRTIERRAPLPTATSLTPEQFRKLEDYSGIERAMASVTPAVRESSVMPFGNKVKVVVVTSDLLNRKYPREALKAKIVEALRSEGISVLADDAAPDAFNTTISATIDTFVQGGTGLNIGSAQLNVLQTGLYGSAGEWRLVNVPMLSDGTIFSYDDENMGKLDGFFDETARRYAAVLRKADAASRAKQGR
jgi:hypothetical protein